MKRRAHNGAAPKYCSDKHKRLAARDRKRGAKLQVPLDGFSG